MGIVFLFPTIPAYWNLLPSSGGNLRLSFQWSCHEDAFRTGLGKRFAHSGVHCRIEDRAHVLANSEGHEDTEEFYPFPARYI